VTSQTDLDQGGTFRQFEKVYLGASVGWAYFPTAVVLTVTAAGAVAVARGTSLITVNVAGAVTLNLPSSKVTAQPLAIPSQSVLAPVTINASGSELISGLASVALSVAYGAVILRPLLDTGGWSLLS
jgi:hypothetical protein